MNQLRKKKAHSITKPLFHNGDQMTILGNKDAISKKDILYTWIVSVSLSVVSIILMILFLKFFTNKGEDSQTTKAIVVGTATFIVANAFMDSITITLRYFIDQSEEPTIVNVRVVETVQDDENP